MDEKILLKILTTRNYDQGIDLRFEITCHADETTVTVRLLKPGYGEVVDEATFVNREVWLFANWITSREQY